MSEDLINMTKLGAIEKPEFNVSTLELLKFLIAYPEICSIKDIRISDLAVFLCGKVSETNYIFVHEIPRALYKAISAWLEVIIRSAHNSGRKMTPVVITQAVGPLNHRGQLRCLPEERKPLSEMELSGNIYSLFGFSFAKEFQFVTEPSIVNNIVVLRKVVSLC